MSQNTTTSTDMELVRKQLEETSLDSLESMRRDHGADNPFLGIDVSGSMQMPMKNGKRRIDGLREVVAQLQGVPMIAFGGVETSEPRFVDQVPEPGGGTPLHAAIQLAKTYAATRMVIISDGLPDDSKRSKEAAVEFGGKIDVVFVGNTDEFEGQQGSRFLDELAKLTGGTRIEASLVNTKEITGKVVLLLEGEVAPDAATKTVFTGTGSAPVEVPVTEEADEEDEDDEDEDEDEDDDDDADDE